VLRICFGFRYSDFVLQPNNYAKQTQFAAHPNERNYCTNNGLSKHQTIQTPEKQTQFQPHHPRTTQPTIKMQNKPNFRNAKMDLTSYGHRDYEHESPLRTPKKQTQSNPVSNPLLFTDNSSSFLALHQLRTPFFNKRARSRTHFFETPQNSTKVSRFSHFFLTFSQFFARFRAFSTPNRHVCVDFLLESPP